ncbi:MAG: flagellar motor switch protein FliG [Parasphingorhabdus sp.]|nr:flagellar motor switch protein FliG [Parasphingorhabdus sp.]
MAEPAQDIVAPLEAKPVSGSESAALLLMLFGEEEAAAILSRLDPDAVQTLGEAMFRVAKVGNEEVAAVLDRFVSKAGRCTTIGYRAGPQIEGMLTRALGPDRAANMLQRIAPKAQYKGLEPLKWMDRDALLSLVEDEHPQLIALMLSQLAPEQAGAVLEALDEAIQEDILFRIATLGPVSEAALADIEWLIDQRSNAVRSAAMVAGGGTSEAAAIMNNVKKPLEQRIIKALAKRDRDLARSIEEEMFIFADLINLDDKNLGALLRAVENETLLLALKGADAGLKARMFGCMSARAAQSIQDEMEDRGPVRMEDVVIAQKNIVAQARALAADGTIMMGGKGDDFV